MKEPVVHTLAGRDISVWAEEDGPIMIKVAEPSGDPVELTTHEAERLRDILARLIAETSP